MMSSDFLPQGCSLRDAERYARELGCQYDPPPGTGEGRWRHPLAGSSGKYNSRKKQANRNLVCWLREVKRRTDAANGSR